jgi:ABC-type polysaccharide/polyol phosphate export permease
MITFFSIFWLTDNLTGLRRFVFVQLNPVCRLFDVVRAPFLRTKRRAASYAAALAITAIG